MAARHPEVKAELTAIQDTLEHYATAHAAVPPAKLRANVLKAIESLSPPNDSTATPANMAGTITNEPVAPVRPMNSRTHGFSPLAIAAMILLSLSAMTNLFLYKRWQRTEQRLALVQQESQLLAQQVNHLHEQNSSGEQQLAFFRQPGVVPVVLKGNDKLPGSELLVYWNAKTHQVMLDAKNLPAPPAGKQYQLWALADGKPVDAGVFQTGAAPAQMQQMKSIAAAQAFAVTIEPAGGQQQPTLEQLVLLGKMPA